MSVTISALYMANEGARFDFDYYTATHLPLIRTRWGASGLTRIDVYRGLSDASGSAPAIHAMALLHFESADTLQAAMGGPHFAEIGADIANFTDIEPILQVNAPL